MTLYIGIRREDRGRELFIIGTPTMNILLKTFVCVVLVCRAYEVYDEIRLLQGASISTTELGCALPAHDVLKGKDAFTNVQQDDILYEEETKQLARAFKYKILEDGILSLKYVRKMRADSTTIIDVLYESQWEQISK